MEDTVIYLLVAFGGGGGPLGGLGLGLVLLPPQLFQLLPLHLLRTQINPQLKSVSRIKFETIALDHTAAQLICQ